MGANRDIPHDARIHPSVYKMFKAGAISEMPKLGGDTPPLLQDPMALLTMFLPWNWSWKSKARRRRAAVEKNPAAKKSMAKVAESHGALSWSWGS